MNFKLKLDPLIVIQKIDGKDVLFSKKTGDFFGLNESAILMLKNLIKTDFDTSIETLARVFTVDREIIKTDLLELVESLEECKLAIKEVIKT